MISCYIFELDIHKKTSTIDFENCVRSDLEIDDQGGVFENPIKSCFADILSGDLTKVFNSGFLSLLLGRDVVDGLTGYGAAIDYNDFRFPLGHFRNAFYIEDNKLMRKDGFAVYIHRGFHDSDHVYFSSKQFSYEGFKLTPQLFFEKLLPSEWQNSIKTLQSLRMVMACGTKGCDAQRTMSFERIDLREKASFNGVNTTSSSLESVAAAYHSSILSNMISHSRNTISSGI